uniref:J domain-containing protein n=1 Tax=Plectus sambesii TaxID=2011161 RepID=A0A914XG22_9BILA
MWTTIVIGVASLLVMRLQATSGESVAHGGTNVYPHDYLCNNGTEHACICYERDNSLGELYLKCERFLEVRTLPVVALSIKQLDMTAILYSGEPYEAYFKRRVARTVSRYCEHKANQCPGTSLRLSQDNVVILAVECASNNETVIRFVVTKARNVGSLTPLMIIQPSRVVGILSGQLGPLERVLGGVKIQNLTVSSITREALVDGEPGYTKKDNTILIVMLLLIALFFVVVYVIAIFKVCKDHHERKRARRKAKSLAAGRKKPSYGAISVHDTANQAGTSSATSPVPRAADVNGRTTTVVKASVNATARRPSSLCSDDFNDPSARRNSIPVRSAPPPPPGAPTLHRRSSNQPTSPPQVSSNHFTVLAETPILSTRGFFVCDESQLPAELPLPPVDVLAEGAPAKQRLSLVCDDDVKRSATTQELSHSAAEYSKGEHRGHDDGSSASDFESDDDEAPDAYHKLSPTASAIFNELTVDETSQQQPATFDDNFTHNPAAYPQPDEDDAYQYPATETPRQSFENNFNEPNAYDAYDEPVQAAATFDNNFTELNGDESYQQRNEAAANVDDPWQSSAHVITVQQSNEETKQWWNHDPETSFARDTPADTGRESPSNGEPMAQEQHEKELLSHRGSLQPNETLGVQPATSEDNLIPVGGGGGGGGGAVIDNGQFLSSTRTKHDTDSESGRSGASSHSSSDAESDSDSEHDPRLAAGLLATGDYHRLAEKITKELNAAEQAASLEKLPSFTPPRTPPEVFVDGRLRIRVKFATLDGQIETFDVGRAQTFETLFRQMSEKLSCSLPEVLVFWEGRSVMSSDTPLKLGLKADDFVIFDIYCKAQIGVKEAHVTSKPEGSISIKFQFQERDKTTTQFVTQEQTFGFIKETYAQNHGLDAAKIFFIFDGDRIGDDSTPSSLEMEDDDCVDVVVHKLSSDSSDFYAVLGVKHTASAKEIKSAYYELSKKHHPDRNPENRKGAAQKFQQVTAAYEVLGSEDQRRDYDADFRARNRVRRPTWSHPTHHHKPHHSSSIRHEPPRRTASAADADDDLPPDFDADYRNFVEFQRSRRRKQRLTRQWQMPPEFYNEFGAPKQRPSKSWSDETEGDGAQSYEDAMSGRRPENWYNSPPVHRDDIWEAREQAELLRKLEREREAQRYKTPTFEQLHQQQREREVKRAKEMMSITAFVAIACLLSFVIIFAPSVTRAPPKQPEGER